MLAGFVGLMVSITLRTSSTSADLSPTSYTYAIAALDAVASVLIIIYTICMSCCLIRDRRGRRSNTVVNYHASQQARMNAMQNASNSYPPSFSQLPPPPAYPAVVTNDSISFGSMQPPPPPQYSSNMNQGLYPSLG